ncbi:hypothetical protein CEXT_553731 [Caerostris extrusa]|uniref:Uncharacterized protein n=1 Tax=Caerostris extrusa TaxID=172846 RepID=A0AAV4PRS6_CAEEX|nr:hypothetical protein CEXT_553731 [Caerostris extrusa]
MKHHDLKVFIKYANKLFLRACNEGKEGPKPPTIQINPLLDAHILALSPCCILPPDILGQTARKPTTHEEFGWWHSSPDSVVIERAGRCPGNGGPSLCCWWTNCATYLYAPMSECDLHSADDGAD